MKAVTANQVLEALHAGLASAQTLGRQEDTLAIEQAIETMESYIDTLEDVEQVFYAPKSL